MQRLLLLSAVLLCAGVLTAQRGKSISNETETEDNYTYQIILRNDPDQRLVTCTNELIEGTIQISKRGRLMTGIDQCSQLTVDNRRHTLTIEHLTGDTAERRRVKEFVAQLAQCLTPPPSS